MIVWFAGCNFRCYLINLDDSVLFTLCRSKTVYRNWSITEFPVQTSVYSNYGTFCERMVSLPVRPSSSPASHTWMDSSPHCQERALCFSSFVCALPCLGYCPWYFSLDKKSKSRCLCPGYLFFLFSWQRGTLSDFGVPFRASSGKDNRLSCRIGTTNTNGLQEELCSGQHTQTHTHTHTLSKPLPLSLLAQTKDQRAFCTGKMFPSLCIATTTDSPSVAYGQWMPLNMHVFTAQLFWDLCQESLIFLRCHFK